MDCEIQFLGPDDEPFQTLSEYCLEESGGLLPFEPIAVLYADESLKDRYVAVPPGEKVTYSDTDRWTFPEGSILVKTFYFWNDARDRSRGRRLLETRLLVLQNGSWEPYIYVWNEEQTEAHFERLGDRIDFDRIDETGQVVSTSYRVPNKNQCASCHEQSDKLVALGPRSFQLNKELDYGGEVGTKNQITHWADLGLFANPPEDLSSTVTLTDFTDPAADLNARARSYLEVNCAHCHNPDGAADPSGLKLSYHVTEPAEFGVCRRPVAAGAGSGGFFYDIVPGRPDESIMIFRMASTDPEIKMPELPTQTSDDFGVSLITEWIASMSPAGCE